eukprot:scaffold117486_cov50-Phaeocystis_antarctica.AAC.3
MPNSGCEPGKAINERTTRRVAHEEGEIRAGYILQSAAPAGPSPWVTGAYHHYRTPHLCVWPV